MKGIISQFVLFLLLLIILWTGVFYLSQNMQYSKAKQCFRDVIYGLQLSDFDEKVVRQYRMKMKEKGYSLQIQIYGKERKYAYVSLDFTFGYPLISQKENYTIEGYAR